MVSLRMEQTSLMLYSTGGWSMTRCWAKGYGCGNSSYFINQGRTKEYRCMMRDNEQRVVILIQLTTMIVALLVGFELVAVLFLGIFARSNSTSTLVLTYSPLYGNCLFLLLAFALLHAPHRKLSLYTLATIALVTAVTVQTFLLFATFWDSCFTGFSSTFTIDITLVTRSLYASLLVLLTALDFLSLLPYWQVYLIMAPVTIIGATLCSSILVRGLNIFDGGGGLLLFFYSGLSSLMIWAVLVKDKVPTQKFVIKKSYFNEVLAIIGVVLAFINWPKFNAAGAFVSYYNVNTSTVTIDYLQNSAIANTYIALSASLLLAFFLLHSNNNEDKLHLQTFVDCFVNGGISIASFQDVALDPTACITIAALSTLLTLILSRKLQQKAEAPAEEGQMMKFMRHYSRIAYRLVLPFLGIIICSMVVGGRSGRSPALLSGSYSKTAGLQIVGFLLVLIIGLIFGALNAYLIKIFITSKEGDAAKSQKEIEQNSKLRQYYRNRKLQLQDSIYFDSINEQNYPIYYDIIQNIGQFQIQKNQLIQYSSRLKERLLGETSNPMQLIQLQKSVRPPNTNAQQPPPPKLNITNDFTKNNSNSKRQLEVSAMKAQLRMEEQKPEEPSAYRKLQLDSNEQQLAKEIQDSNLQNIQASQQKSTGMITFRQDFMLRSKQSKEDQDIPQNLRSQTLHAPIQRGTLNQPQVNIGLTSSRIKEQSPRGPQP